MTSPLNGDILGGTASGGRTGIGKNDRVKGVVDGPDDPQKAAFINKLIERYNLRAVSLAPAIVQEPQAPPKRRRRHNQMADPKVPMKLRPVDVHVNGSPEVKCCICGRTVERATTNQITCGSQRCKNKRINRERVAIDPAELLAACVAKGVVA